MMPEVSIVMAAYNHGPYVSRAIESALSQTMPNVELLVVDDGSTDDTPDVVHPYLIDTRVRYFRQNNCGQACAKNLGIFQSRGSFIAFLDADDIWKPNKLELQLPLFADPNVGVVHAQREVIDPLGRPLAYPTRSLPRGDVLNDVFIDNFVCFSSSIVRRKCFEELGVFNECLRVGIDYDLWIRLASSYTFDHIEEILVSYRTGHRQLSIYKTERLKTAFMIMDKCLDNPFIRPRIHRKTIRKAYAMTHNSAAIVYMDLNNNRKTIESALRSVKYNAIQIDAYKIILKYLAPQWALKIFRSFNKNKPSDLKGR